jgi:predicted nucleic acid-binding protein
MIAVDTNVLVYSVDRSDPQKRTKARDLLRRLRLGPTPTVLLWQVAGEFLRWLRWSQDQGQMNPAASRRYLGLFRQFYPLVMPVPAILDRALDLAARHNLSHWDNMLLAGCLEVGVDTLYIEDMGAPTRIESIQLINPFI